MRMEKNLEISTLLDYYGELLTENQKDFVDLYYNEDLYLAEIAEHKGITRQGVRDNIKRGENYLLELESKLKIAEKYRNIGKKLDMAIMLSNEIYVINDTYKFSKDIYLKTQEINKICNSLLDESLAES